MSNISFASFFPIQTIILMAFCLVLTGVLVFLIFKDRKAMMTEGVSSVVVALKGNEITLISLTALVLVAAFVYMGSKPIADYNVAVQAAAQKQQQFNAAMGLPVSCPGQKTPSVKTDVTGYTVNFLFNTPVNEQWGIDYGDGQHTPVLLTTQSVPYNQKYTYSQAGEYAAIFLAYDPTTHCEARSIIHVNLTGK